ncbi:MAG TPA: flagellar basal body protein FliL [Thermoanaerobacterales bacterium]|nr:flagellar basal body protein FliL [Thermoanaerobacterales bacterium]
MATVQTNQSNKINFRSIILIILVLFLLMIMTTGIAYFVVKNYFQVKPEQVESNKQPVTYSAGDFLTNLSDRGYIKVSLIYLLENKDVEKQLQSKDYEIRDRIFSILRSKNFDSVKDSRGMEDLRKQIREAINSILAGDKIIDVYFTSIIVN